MAIQAFNLGEEATRYLAGVPKGHKSKRVNQAILFYKDNGIIYDARDKLQAIVLQQEQELEELRADLGLNHPSRGGYLMTLIVNILAYPFNLLKNRLFRR